MERQLSLECLPFEVLVQIASYLGIQDIAASCATSSLLRDAFNDDLLWKRHVDLKKALYLNQSECLVEPFFVWEDEDSTLSPICNWRRNYMMQVRLFKNWRHGVYEREKVVFGPNNVIFHGTKVAFYDSDYLFLHTTLMNENKMLHEIWDVKDTPYLHSTLNVNFSEYMQYEVDDFLRVDIFKIVGNKLVVAQNNLVLIYDISLSSFSCPPLDHAFLFNTPEEVLKDQIKCHKKSFFQNAFFEIAHQVETIVSGNYFIGTVTSSQDLIELTLHIWNIQTGKKVKEECVPTKNIEVSGFQLLSSQNETDIIVKLRVNKDKHMYHYYGYDLTQLEYSSFLVKLNYCDFLILTGDYAAGVGPQKLFVYDYKTSEKLLTKKCSHQILKRTLAVIGNNMLFGTFDNTIHVLNLSTQSIINCVKLGFTLYSLQAISNKFVVINSSNSEVWEIGQTAKKLFKFPSDGSFVAVNDSCTKLVIEKENKLIILNFW